MRSAWIAQVIESGLANGFSIAEVARMSRFIGSAQATANGCYVIHQNNRYGDFHYDDGSRTNAHRVIYEALHGLLPDDLVVRHKCDVRACVRPTHLAVRAAAVGHQWAHVDAEPVCEISPRNAGSSRLRVPREDVEPLARAAFESGESLRSISRRIPVGTGTLTRWKREWEADAASKVVA